MTTEHNATVSAIAAAFQWRRDANPDATWLPEGFTALLTYLEDTFSLSNDLQWLVTLLFVIEHVLFGSQAHRPIVAFGVDPRLAAVSRAPQARGLRWHHRRSAHLEREQAGHRERLIAHDLRAQTIAWRVPEQAVRRIDLRAGCVRLHSGALTIGVAHDDELEQRSEEHTSELQSH